MQAFPVTPFFGDIAISLNTILSKAPNIKNLKWDLHDENESLASLDYRLPAQLEASRIEYRGVISNLFEIQRVLYAYIAPCNFQRYRVY